MHDPDSPNASGEGGLTPPVVLTKHGEILAVDLRTWVRQYVNLLIETEGVKVAKTSPPPVQEASNDR